MLKTIYPDSYANSSAQANVSSITFAGTVVGMLFFGYTSDHFSRKWSLFTSTIIIILFAILGTASYGAGGSPSGLLTALVVYRFFLGIGTWDCICFFSINVLTCDRYRRRVSSRQCRLRRIHRRTQARNAKQVVHPLHQRADRPSILHQRHRRDRRCPRYGRRPSTSRLAYLPGYRNHPTSFAAIPPIEVTGARGVQARVAGQDEDTMAAYHQVLLVPPQYRQHHLVHLRLQRVLVWYLRDVHLGQFTR